MHGTEHEDDAAATGEQAVRAVIDDFLRASEKGDVDATLDLLADDVVFLTPSRPPFGKEEFAKNARQQQAGSLQAASEIIELEVVAGWAWMRSELRVTMTPPGGEPITRSGPVLTVLRKTDGRWQIARDANFLS